MTFTRRTFLGAAPLVGGAALAAAGRARAQGRAAPLRVGIIPILAAAPIFVAEKEGWLKEAGLTLAITTFESGPNMIQALASGTLDVYVAGVAPLGVARARGIDVKVVTATAVEENVFVAGSRLARHFEPGLAPAEAFRRYRAAAGAPARLATQPLGSVPNTTLQHWLWEVAKADPKDVTLVSMGIDATQQAILVGAVEGGTLREPAVSIVTGRDSGIRLVALGGAMFPGQPGTVVALTRALLDREPEAAQAVVTGIVRAVDLIGREPGRVAPVVEAALGKGLVDLATIRRALASPATRFTADPGAIVEATAAMQRYQVKLGALDREVPLNGLFEPRLYARAAASR
ncbi:ABC-type nitrate/sulfonate/bicarbonate transport systems periplasmic components-like protein [Methylobacterium sp. 4-46]|uniref:ABC transporter substrate-binding protein n=1 Tax=unclassified Methylobacterium TaxID=2615210 RepID=UPI000152CDC3|nr:MULTISPECIES: ABC transporter substrate-binding protein [Methylobacterium]ACA17843.1 ABC-type nitrate/sulfonate/bicarbonate transport systems periplasmic components-like protein [Methylobacterium sp. 4-46]WFT77149.1 ABC transporter substrate-binding protein [Methylobacterium nodulans]